LIYLLEQIERFYIFSAYLNFPDMNRNEILTRVKDVVSNVLKMDASEITDDANFIFDLGADSMQSIELVAGFEEEFGIEMDQEKALEIQTIGDAVNFISQHL
jgi:acyl carrier protein